MRRKQMLIVYPNNTVSGYICFLSSMCSGYRHDDVLGPVFIDGKFVFILFVMVIVLLADET